MTRPKILTLLAIIMLALGLASCDIGAPSAPAPTPTPVSDSSGVATATAGTSGDAAAGPTATSGTNASSGSGSSATATSDTSPSTSSAPDVPYEPAAQKLVDSKSYHFVIVKTDTLQNRKIDTVIEGDIDRPGDKVQYKIEASSEGEPIVSGKGGEWITVGNKSYHNVNGAWTAEAPPGILPEIKDVKTIIPDSRASEPKLMSGEVVASEESSRYQYTAAYKNTQGATYDVWVNKSTGQILRVKITVPDGRTGYMATITKMDEPVSISEPR
jgi:hypothetical protein